MRIWIGHKICLLLPLANIASNRFIRCSILRIKKFPDRKSWALNINRYEGTEYDMMKARTQADVRLVLLVSPMFISSKLTQIFRLIPVSSSGLQWVMQNTLYSSPHSVESQTLISPDKINSNNYSASNMYWACKRICGIAEQDREFLSQGVKDFWKAQEESMYKSTAKDVKALKKAYKKSKKDGRAYATKLAKSYASKQLRKLQQGIQQASVHFC